MTESNIDRTTGTVRIDGMEFRLGSDLGQVISAYAERMKLQEQRVGWDEFKVEGLAINTDILTMRLLFNKRKLEIIEFYMNFKEIQEPESWEGWTEEFELKKELKLNEWLNNQIGTNRAFEWGIINAFFDRRSGYSSIIMNR